MTTISEILKESRDCIGTPYKHQGRLKGIGMDCAGVIVHVGKLFDLFSHDVTGYTPTPWRGLISQALRDAGFVQKKKADLTPSDVLLMRFQSEPQHLGIYTDTGTIIHSYSRVGKVVEHRYSGVWISRTVTIWQWPGVEA